MLTEFENHAARRDNPHNVTKEQVGLGNVENYALADKTEVIKMERDDLYIDSTKMSWVQEALLTYMYNLGLVNGKGEFIIAPIDHRVTVETNIDEFNGLLTLHGTHSTAVSVDVRVREVYFGVLQETLLFERLNTPIIDTIWTVDTTGIHLTHSREYQIELLFRDLEGLQIGRYVHSTQDSYTDYMKPYFVVDPENNIHIYGFSPNAFTVQAVIKNAMGQVLGTVNNIIVDNNQNKGGFFHLISSQLNKNFIYKVEITAFNRHGNELGRKDQESVSIHQLDKGLFYYNTIQRAWYYDMRYFGTSMDNPIRYIDKGRLPNYTVGGV